MKSVDSAGVQKPKIGAIRDFATSAAMGSRFSKQHDVSFTEQERRTQKREIDATHDVLENVGVTTHLALLIIAFARGKDDTCDWCCIRGRMRESQAIYYRYEHHSNVLELEVPDCYQCCGDRCTPCGDFVIRDDRGMAE